jgi:hypothetical protein
MFNRAVAGAAFALLLASGVWSEARARQPLSQTQVADQTGWVFNIAPYVWLPTINSTLNYNLPPALGGRLPTDVSIGPGDLLSHLDFAAMFAADARNGPFSVLTDFMYTLVSACAGHSHIKEVDLFGLSPIPISRSLQTSISTTLGATIWTLAGGQTVPRDGWATLM